MTDSNLPSTSNQGRGPDPFTELHRRIDRLFSDFSRGFDLPTMWGNGEQVMPSMEMHDGDGKLTVTAELPGVDENDIDVSIDGDMLTISGEKRSEHESKEGGVTRSERSYGKFSRSVSLPFEPDSDKVDARFDKGVLKLTIEKPADAHPKARRIEIRH